VPTSASPSWFQSATPSSFLVAEAAELADRLKSLGEPREEMLLEEYLVGADIPATAPFADYLSVETAVSDGELSHLALTGRFPPAPDFRETGSSYPPLSTTRAATSCSTWRQRQQRRLASAPDSSIPKSS
jgi:hypothetical protein